jgi:hypothetical protein
MWQPKREALRIFTQCYANYNTLLNTTIHNYKRLHKTRNFWFLAIQDATIRRSILENVTAMTVVFTGWRKWHELGRQAPGWFAEHTVLPSSVLIFKFSNYLQLLITGHFRDNVTGESPPHGLQPLFLSGSTHITIELSFQFFLTFSHLFTIGGMEHSSSPYS